MAQSMPCPQGLPGWWEDGHGLGEVCDGAVLPGALSAFLLIIRGSRRVEWGDGVRRVLGISFWGLCSWTRKEGRDHGDSFRGRGWKMWRKECKHVSVELKESLLADGSLVEMGVNLVRGWWVLGSKGQQQGRGGRWAKGGPGVDGKGGRG